MCVRSPEARASCGRIGKLAQPGITAVRATTFPWHAASLGVIRHLGMRQIGTREHDTSASSSSSSAGPDGGTGATTRTPRRDHLVMRHTSGPAPIGGRERLPI